MLTINEIVKEQMIQTISMLTINEIVKEQMIQTISKEDSEVV